MLRERLCLWLILAARRAGRWGFTDDHLEAAEREQRTVIAARIMEHPNG